MRCLWELLPNILDHETLGSECPTGVEIRIKSCQLGVLQQASKRRNAR